MIDSVLLGLLYSDAISGRGPLVIIQGGARGADLIARDRCAYHDIKFQTFPAEWDRYGKAAGPIRNQQMLDEGKPDCVIAFHDDIENSRGTKDMVERARKAGLTVHVESHRG